jgi:hypothetical protein
MDRKSWYRSFFLAAVALVIASGVPGTALAQYDPLDSWFFIYVEGGVATPKSTDQFVGVSVDAGGSGQIQTSTYIQPDWSSSPVFRVGGGFRWGGGSSVTVSYWQFDDDQQVAANGPVGGDMLFTIGPFIDTGSGFANSGSPGHSDFTAGIQAQTVDIAWGRLKTMGDFFDVEWSLGLRYAHFEETVAGIYDNSASTSASFGLEQWGAFKFNEGEMFGARAAVRGTYFLTDRIAGTASVGFSMLQGEVTSTSSFWDADLGGRPAATATINDDNRSGRIQDLDIGIMLFLSEDTLRLKLGYESSFWDGVSSDLLRNTNGAAITIPDREQVGFSAFTFGLYLQF